MVKRKADWLSVDAHPVDRLHVGLCLRGTLAVLRHLVVPLDSWTEKTDEFYFLQDRIITFNVLHVERVPPGQVEPVAKILSMPSLKKRIFMIGYEAAERPIADAFERAGLGPTLVKLSPTGQTLRDGSDWTTSTEALAAEMNVRLNAGELKIRAAVGALTGDAKLAVQIALFGAVNGHEVAWTPFRV